MEERILHAEESVGSLKGERTAVRRHAERAHYDRHVVHSIIDESLVCHVAFDADGVAMCLPTMHARIGDALYLHGAVGNGMLRELGAASYISATFTIIDGLVFARAAMNHSMNYRSVVVFGPAAEVTDWREKRAALDALVERAAPGRALEVRAPSEAELRSTRLLKLTIAEASAKVRSGGACDDASDLSLPIFAGVLPLQLASGAIERDAALDPLLGASPAVRAQAQALGQPHDAIVEWRRGESVVSTDRSRLDLDFVHEFLSEQSYWARGVERSRCVRSFASSYCFGLYRGETQLAFARVVADGSRFAYLADVFVAASERGKGLGRWLIECILSHPELQECERWLLGTRDAAAFYARFGFEAPPGLAFLRRLRVGASVAETPCAG